ncbi:MAG: hypothetical protein PVF22_01670 [Candidatus Aminicenantes bacterium]|jgi:hypothetical protein
MERTPRFLFLLFFFLCSLPLVYLLAVLLQVRDYTVYDHSVRLRPILFMAVACLVCALLFGLWLLSAKFLSLRFGISPSRAESLDVLSYVPFYFLLLLPIVNTRYITSGDFASRVTLLGIAVLFGVLWIKLITLYKLGQEGSHLLQKYWLKISALPLRKKLVLLFFLALLAFNAGSVLMIAGGISFSGDEPHYLLITNSLLKDGDFNLAADYANQDYSAYMPEGVKLDAHTALESGGYSFHSPGVAIFLLPFYVLGTLFSKGALLYLVRFGMSVFGALLGVQIFLYARQEWKSEKWAGILWLVFCFTTPIFFHSLHVYPEILLALFSLTIFRMLRFSDPLTKPKLVFIGILLGLFIWLHAVKYMFILVPLLLYCLWVLGKKHRVGWNAVYFLAGPLLCISLHTLFSYTLYGSLSPFSVSLKGATSPAESFSLIKGVFLDVAMKTRLETLLGYFFDQRDGLLLYAPVYFFGFLGMIELGRRDFKKLLVLLFLSAPYVLGQAFLTQRGAYAPQARTQVAVFWVMGIFLGYFLVNNVKKIFIYFFSAALAFSFLCVSILIGNPWALYQPTTYGETQRAGQLFIHMSNLHFYLPQFLPSYLKTDNRGWLPNYIWIGVFFLFIAGYVLVKKHSLRLKPGVSVIIVCLALLLVFFWGVLYPHPVLLSPENMTFPSGEKVTFYSLGRVLRMTLPGEFQLPRDNRSYVFFLTSWRPIEAFNIDFGSKHGVFDVEIRYFDQKIFAGQIREEKKSVRIPASPCYRLKKRNLYRISIELKKESGLLAYSHPFLFKIMGSDLRNLQNLYNLSLASPSKKDKAKIKK